MAVAMHFTLESSGESVSPGGLYSLIKDISDGSYKELVLKGEVRASELMELKSLSPRVEVLDLRDLIVLPAHPSDGKYSGSVFSDGASIPPYALLGSRVKRVILPSTLQRIGEGAFAESAVEHVTFPASLREIGDHAFYRCVNLKEADLSATGVSEIPDHCYYGCASLKNVLLPSSVTSIGEKAFMNSSVERLNLSSVTRIAPFAFSSLPFLEEVILNNGVSVGEGAFYGNRMLSGITGIFKNSPELMLAGSGSKIGKLRLASEVIESGACASLNCDTVKLGKEVREIRRDAFRNAESLACVDVVACKSTPPALDPDAFAGLDVSKITLKVLMGEEEIWRNSEGWKDFIILSASAVDEIKTQTEDVRIERQGKRFLLSSQSDMLEVEIYNPSGVILHRSSPGTTTHQTPEISGERIVILRVRTPATTKVATLSVGS